MTDLISKFPQELIDKICDQFTNQQKSVCQSVCQAWRDPFAKSQYYSIHIRGQKQFRLFYEALKVNGHHIHRLTMTNVCLLAREFASLPDRFPNLNSLTLAAVEVSDTTKSRNLFSQWKYLVSLDQDVMKNIYVSRILHLNLYLSFQRLSTLSDAKCLKTLTIQSGSISLGELEMIHENCPHLTHLRLVDVTIEKSSALAPIRPATSLRSLEVESMPDLNASNSWSSYLSAKYPNLHHLVYWSKIDHLASLRSLSAEEKFQSIATISQCCQQLTSIYLLNIPVDEGFFRSLDQSEISLTHLGLGDLTGRTMTSLKCLIRSRQSPSHLTLWGWGSLCVETTMESVLHLISQCELTSLDFSMQHSGVRNVTFPFHNFLNTNPRLEKLQLGYVQVIPSTVRRSSKLNRIFLFESLIRSSWFSTLAFHCNDLNHLSIHRSTLIISPNRKVEIHMPHHAIDTIDLHQLKSTSNHYRMEVGKIFDTFRILQTSPGTCLVYKYDPHEETIKAHTHPTVPPSHISIQCASLNELRISHLRAST
ncbi:hypothetical protein BY458DRAFT_523695 [Sporodiniella umbellata]|nr:hypothetical protein BY458DRAFT_523695 [Sporodiniella umbellata]